jgi:hypothetical protein
VAGKAKAVAIKANHANALRTNTSSAANAMFLGSNAYDPVSWVASLHHGTTIPQVGLLDDDIH